MPILDPYMGEPLSKLEISKTDFAIVDLETTGIDSVNDRIVEIANRRYSPERESSIVFDTLINPLQKIKSTHIHGIQDQDVRNAPTFEEAAHKISGLLSGAVLASYNVNFDYMFLREEFKRIGAKMVMPFV